MLEPHDRAVLLEALRPPDRYELDEAIGTTFTLDLLALLTAPVGFTLLELQDTDREEIGRGDELLLLRTLRQYANRMTIFCQAGRIAEPKGQKMLFSYLEKSVVEVTAPTPGGIFHPKVWALRYVSQSKPVRYRILVLSRNLTFATSWDTILKVDGELIERHNAFTGNHPLGDFVQALPTFAIRPVDKAVNSRIDRIQRELRRVKFKCPEHVEAIAWHPIGISLGAKDPLDTKFDKIAVVSPFLTATRLGSLAPQRYGATLVSTLHQLERQSADQLAGFDQIFAMSPDASPIGDDTAGDAEGEQGACDGLHAKLYVADQGWNTSVFTGSANATSAAFSRNVEFLAELVGKKSKLGVDVLLAQREGVTTFRDLLIEYMPRDQPIVDDEIEQELECLTDEVRLAIGSTRWLAEVSKSGEAYDMTLRPSQPPIISPAVVRMAAQPITLKESWRQLDTVSHCATFTTLSLAALTPFFTFEVTVRYGGREATCRFVVNVELIGEPPNRRDAILAGLLKDRQRLVRFLLLLLFDDEQMLAGDGTHLLMDEGGGSSTTAPAPQVHSLLEPLLRALHRDPRRLDQVEQLLREFGDSKENGESLIPPDLRTVFAPIWAARQRVRR